MLGTLKGRFKIVIEYKKYSIYINLNYLLMLQFCHCSRNGYTYWEVNSKIIEAQDVKKYKHIHLSARTRTIVIL